MNGEVRSRGDHEMKNAILAIAFITVAAILSMTIQSFAEDGAAKPMHVMLPPDAIQWKPFPPLGSGVEWARPSPTPPAS